MWIYAMPLFLVGLLTFSPQVAGAEVTIDSIELAVEVRDREPVSPLTPPAFCDQDKNSQSAIPVFDSSLGDRVFFWNRLQTSGVGVLRHTWYRNDDKGWAEAAGIELRFSKSSAYRTWSSKQIMPSLHTGDWKVEVSTAAEPDRVLCTTRFRVK